MMDIKNRIYEYLRIVKMTPAEFERNTGLSNGYLRNIKNSIGVDKISNIVSVYPDLNLEWLITGNGEMLKSNHTSSTTSSAQVQISANTKPRIPYTAAAGSITNAVEGISESQCEQVPVVPTFPSYDFTIIVKGDSMEPKIEGGDEVACKRVDQTSFIQWGKVHVLDTAQGIVIKRIYEDGDKIKCVSYNPEYPPFSIDKSEIYSISLVVGLLRI